MNSTKGIRNEPYNIGAGISKGMSRISSGAEGGISNTPGVTGAVGAGIIEGNC